METKNSTKKNEQVAVASVIGRAFPIFEKAFTINLDKIYDGFHYPAINCRAKNRNEAKVKMLDYIRYDNMHLRIPFVPVTYLNMPIIRTPQEDKVFFENEVVRRGDIQDILYKRERLQKLNDILENPDIEYCYIMKRGEYYRPGSSGYTGFKIRAGVYTKQEAVSDGKSCVDLNIIPINIQEHNALLEKEIAEMTKRLLPCR